MNEILRMGMAGLGIASTQLLLAAARLPNMKITAASDLKEEALNEIMLSRQCPSPE